MIVFIAIVSMIVGGAFLFKRLAASLNNNESESIGQKRWKKFKSLKRGYYSLIIILFLYTLSWFNFLIISNKPIIVYHDSQYYFPALKAPPAIGPYSPDWKDPYTWETFGYKEMGIGEPKYRELDKLFKSDNSDSWMIMPVYPYSPYESLSSELDGTPPTKPTKTNFFGTDSNGGRDVFARMAYAFNYTLTFALVVTMISYVVGIAIGALLGYFGGLFDIIGQRFIEIVSTIPFLFTVIIIRESFDQPPGLIGLALILVCFSWMGMTYYIRGEFYREKAKDYVSAAVSMGQSNKRVMFKHILPNALTPIITFAPFAVIGNIFSLTTLDYLGFGLEPPMPSWGEIASQGIAEFRWWLIFAPMISSFISLILISFIGESVREAFDPKVHSRLR